MRDISLAGVIEKNKLSSDVAFLMLLEVQIKNTDTGLVVDTVYLANNDEDVTYQSTVYTALPFDLNIKAEAGAMPELSLTIFDPAKILLSRINELSGASGSDAIVRVVRSNNLTGEPEFQEYFEITSTTASNFGISFQLGAPNFLAKRFPRRIQLRDRCAWRYKSAECGYTGAMPTCDLSLQGPNGCAAHNNTLNYGGFPALRSRAVRAR